MLSKGMRSLSTPIAKVASISHDLGQVTGLDVSSEVGLVPEVGDARDAFPLSINFGHVHGHIRCQRLSFAWKIKTTLLTFLQMMVRVTTMLLADAKHFFFGNSRNKSLFFSLEQSHFDLVDKNNEVEEDVVLKNEKQNR